MSENPIAISNLNDFIFCPVLSYFHSLDYDTEKMTYQNSDQLNGTAVHTTVDSGTYSSKKSINLKQIKEDDFLLIKGQYRLKWNCSAKYVQFLMKPIMEEKESIFLYIQSYYRAFVKKLEVDKFPVFDIGE